jgi:eukaryotic-like serine/threonine-protein kinase
MNKKSSYGLAAGMKNISTAGSSMVAVRGAPQKIQRWILYCCCIPLLTGILIMTGACAAEHTVASSGAEFTEIQAAIAWAMPGDTITVESGLYPENIRIDKKINLVGIDSGGGTPVIDPGKNGNGIEILADGCSVSGFEIQNSNLLSGIRVGSNGNTVSDNVLKNNAQGIYLISTGKNFITGNIITGSLQAGISLEDSKDNTIEGNRVTDNSIGIVLDDRSPSNHIYHNMFSNTQNVASKSTTTSWESSPVMAYTYLGRTMESRMGNYWSDYRGKDRNGDGIGDTQYVISLGGNQKAVLPVNKDVFDSFPLMDPKEYYTNITPAIMVSPAPASVITETATQGPAKLGSPEPSPVPMDTLFNPSVPSAQPSWLSPGTLVILGIVVLLGGAGLFIMFGRKKKVFPRPRMQAPSPSAGEPPAPPADLPGVTITTGDTTLAGIEESLSITGEQKYYFPKDLENKYTGIQYIGRGGVAHVYAARRKTDDKQVAVKIPISFDEVTGKCFLNEINAWESLRHPNIVEVLAVNILPVPYVEMEYVPGSLEAVKKPLPVWKAVHLVSGIADALKYAHAHGFIHRDIKPHNILVTDDLVPKITDWGMSKVMATEMKKSSVAGFSLSYAAPEQVSPSEFGRTDARTDIYQLGVVFYELVTGTIPFGGDSIVEVGNAIVREKPIPPSEYTPDATAVEKIILTCLEKRPEDRYQSAAELLDALSGYLDEDDE